MCHLLWLPRAANTCTKLWRHLWWLLRNETSSVSRQVGTLLVNYKDYRKLIHVNFYHIALELLEEPFLRSNVSMLPKSNWVPNLPSYSYSESQHCALSIRIKHKVREFISSPSIILYLYICENRGAITRYLKRFRKSRLLLNVQSK